MTQAVAAATKQGRIDLSDLSDELITSVLKHLSFEELVSAHNVNRRFNRLLSRPDPGLKVFGSSTITINPKEPVVPIPALARYLFKRIAGFQAVRFRSIHPFAGNEQKILNFFRVSLPQLAGVFGQEKINIQIEVQDGGEFFFPGPAPHEGEEYEDSFFNADYWELLAPSLTSLTLQLRDSEHIVEVPRLRLMYLLSLRNLQVLKLIGPDDNGVYYSLPQELGWPALRVLRLENFLQLPTCQLDCPCLEELHIENVLAMDVPKGLGACSRLSVLEIVLVHESQAAQFTSEEALLAAVRSVQASIEVLEMSGLRLTALPQWFSTLPRLQTLRLKDNKLSVLPSLPASIRALDLRGNDFTEIPAEIESMTQLTSLAMSSRQGEQGFQIRRSLDPVINLPNLRSLVLAPEAPPDEVYDDRWNVQSLCYLGLAEHELLKSNSKLQLSF